jgi:hypothetical protein
VRPIPSFARALGESCVISLPWKSIVPELGGTSPEMTLKSVVLLAVRAAHSAGAHGVEAAEAPADPPQAEDRLGVLWCCFRGHSGVSR